MNSFSSYNYATRHLKTRTVNPKFSDYGMKITLTGNAQISALTGKERLCNYF